MTPEERKRERPVRQWLLAVFCVLLVVGLVIPLTIALINAKPAPAPPPASEPTMPLGLWALIFAAGWVGIAVEWSFEHWPFVFAVIALWLLWRIAEGVKAKKECRRPVLAPPSVQW